MTAYREAAAAQARVERNTALAFLSTSFKP